MTPTTPASSSTSTAGAASGGGGFTVQPAVLRGAAGCTEAEADALAEAGATLTARLAALHGCWGDDEVGQRFAAAYLPAADTVMSNLHALTWGLVRIGAALRAVADSYERTDQLVAVAATTEVV